jgi:hypothetical protein
MIILNKPEPSPLLQEPFEIAKKTWETPDVLSLKDLDVGHGGATNNDGSGNS